MAARCLSASIGARLSLLFVILLGSACADAETRIKSMTVTEPPATNQGVAMTGAPPVPAPPALYREAIALGTVKSEPPSSIFIVITDDIFREALRRSLAASGLLAPAGAPGRFSLDAELEAVKRPVLATTMEIRTTARYRLVEIATGREVLSVRFEETGVATVGEYIVGAQRAQVAEARSIRQSLGRLLAVLYGRPQV